MSDQQRYKFSTLLKNTCQCQSFFNAASVVDVTNVNHFLTLANVNHFLTLPVLFVCDGGYPADPAAALPTNKFFHPPAFTYSKTLDKFFHPPAFTYSNLLDSTNHMIYDIRMTNITCAITGQTYTSPSHAAKGVGVSLPTALKSINTGAAIKHRPLGVYTWLVSATTPALQPPKDARQQPVHCVTTNTTYSTMSEAADAHGLDLTALSRAIREDRPLNSHTTGGKVKFIRHRL